MSIEALKGETLVSIDVQPDTITFHTERGMVWKMHHHQECCESVYVEDVVGDVEDLVGSPILLAEEVSNTKRDDDEDESCTWTFYKLATINGHVDIRWYGSSNGYYSESVDVELVRHDPSKLGKLEGSLPTEALGRFTHWYVTSGQKRPREDVLRDLAIGDCVVFRDLQMKAFGYRAQTALRQMMAVIEKEVWESRGGVLLRENVASPPKPDLVPSPLAGILGRRAS